MQSKAINLDASNFNHSIIKIYYPITQDLTSKSMKIIITLCLIIFSYTINAQKKPITNDTYLTWTTVSGGGLSNNGKFAYYTINNEPKEQNTTIITSTDKKWSIQFANLSNPHFTDDSKKLLGLLGKDSLLTLDLYTRSVSKTPKVTDYKIIRQNGTEKLIKYSEDESLTIGSITGKEEKKYNNIQEYTISLNGSSALLKQIINDTVKNSNVIRWVNLINNKSKILYVGEDAIQMIISKDGKNASFLTTGKEGNKIWNYNSAKNEIMVAVDEKKWQLDTSSRIEIRPYRFTKDGKYIIFSLRHNDQSQTPKDFEISPNFWNYQDLILRSAYFYDNGNKKYNYESFAIVNLENGEVHKITNENEKKPVGFDNEFDSLLVLETMFGETNEIASSKKISYKLLYIKTGKEINIVRGINKRFQNISLSPRSTYLSFYDPDKNNYFTFNIKEEKLTNVSVNAKENFSRCSLKGYPDTAEVAAGMIGWTEDEKKIIVNGEYDIWSLDPTGIDPPENLTKGYGANNKIVFNLALESEGKNLKWDSEVILSMTNLNTKFTGFLKLKLSNNAKLNKIKMEPYYIYPMENIYFQMNPDHLVKSKNSKTYLVLRQNANESPNYYITSDLLRFTAISNNKPQENYNWLTAELQTYRDESGVIYKGVLYKPENFDSTKKYPILFNYYTEKSNLVNSFPSVEPPSGDFNIPMAVSEGYIVFLPDMISKIGQVGDGAVNSILAAVNSLSLHKWADTSRMGIAGHSFGGFETNYIITHCNKFKAALSGAGVSEFVSMCYDIWGSSGYSKQNYYKNLVPKMGATLLEKPEIYLRNSPLLLANKITTPVLFLHNTEDKAVPFRQSRQFFIALRSLNKRAWWLNYPNEGHGLGSYENRIDFSKKVFEFFNYFLKGDPMPDWMNKYLSPTNLQ